MNPLHEKDIEQGVAFRNAVYKQSHGEINVDEEEEADRLAELEEDGPYFDSDISPSDLVRMKEESEMDDFYEHSHEGSPRQDEEEN